MTVAAGRTRRLSAAIAGAVLAGACSSGSGTAVTVDGVAIAESRLEELHVDVGELDEDERVGAVLLLVLQEAFSARAEAQLGLTLDPSEVEQSYQTALDPIRARGEPAEVLAARNETETRLRLTSELDALRDRVGGHLVRTESGGFDLAAAEQAYRLANAEVCVRHIQLADGDDGEAVLQRLAEGEPFEDVARQLSIDPFVDRPSGVGAGGDLGCSAPSALPSGLDAAALEAPIGEPTGPVVSSVGLHVVEVYDRTEPDLVAEHDEVVEAAVSVQGPQLFRLWAVDVLLDIEVEVDRAYGQWGILPETAPVPTVVPPYRYVDIIE